MLCCVVVCMPNWNCFGARGGSRAGWNCLGACSGHENREKIEIPFARYDSWFALFFNLVACEFVYEGLINSLV